MTSLTPATHALARLKTGDGKPRLIVVGGGPVGLSAALALAQESEAWGVEIVLVTAKSPTAGTGAQARSAALFPASLALLQNLGVLEACWPTSAPLKAIRLIDDTGGLLRAPEVLFTAAEIGAASFGSNVPNATLVAALEDALSRQGPGFRWLKDRTVADVSTGDSGVQVHLADGEIITGCLVAAADGRQSPCRAGAGIAVKDWQYDQVAVTTGFTHHRAHDGISTEFHGPAGPCTTVPLPGRASTLVWVERPGVANRLLAMDDDTFKSALETRLNGLLGAIATVTPRGKFPLSGLQAETYAARRVLLIGEAAHVMPPIGAQGLNLGLRDVASLVDCVREGVAGGGDPGGPEVLAAYNKARAADIGLRMTAVDALNRSLLTDLIPVKLARGFGLHVLSAFGPLRRRLIAEGLTPSGAMPRLMQG
jgi:2-octaprenyl-6-methoxyphenol hydroxylase